jgi:DNA-binding MarR family transcriptional regulator
MTTDELDPLIHVPTRLRIVAALAAQPDGDPLSFARLQDMIGLSPGNLITHLRKLEEAGYVASEKTKDGTATKTTVTLTGRGRAALSAHTQALRNLLGGLDGNRRAADAGAGPPPGAHAITTPRPAAPTTAPGTHRTTRHRRQASSTS